MPSSTPYPFQANALRWLYVDFNSYFASVEQELNPALRGKPIAVVAVETDATCAIAASYEAKAYGIRTGTPIHEAKRLCPAITCVLAQHEKYTRFHHLILEEIERHIPISAVCSIDEMACRLMDNENSVERATEIAHAIKQGLARTIGKYVRCSIGIAPNRYLAKIATDLKKPDGLTFIAASDLPQKLFRLRLRDLPGIGYAMERRFLKAGIADLPALWELSPDRMRRIWGSIWGERIWYMLRGGELPEQETTRSTVGHSHVLAPDLRVPAKAHYVARRLTLKAAARLRRMGYYASVLSFAARLESGERLEGQASCFRAQDSVTFLTLLESLWNRALACAPEVRIKKVSVTLHGLVPAAGLQPELFAPLPDADLRKRAKAEKMSHALDKINHRFGRDSITLGMMPSEGRSFSGTKIAFTRIPDMEEFLE